MTHSIEEARTELVEAREAGRRPAVWATEMALEALDRDLGSQMSEADLDALDDAVFGQVTEMGRSRESGGRGAGSREVSESYLDELDDAVFGRPGGSKVDSAAAGSGDVR